VSIKQNLLFYKDKNGWKSDERHKVTDPNRDNTTIQVRHPSPSGIKFFMQSISMEQVLPVYHNTCSPTKHHPLLSDFIPVT